MYIYIYIMCVYYVYILCVYIMCIYYVYILGAYIVYIYILYVYIMCIYICICICICIRILYYIISYYIILYYILYIGISTSQGKWWFAIPSFRWTFQTNQCGKSWNTMEIPGLCLWDIGKWLFSLLVLCSKYTQRSYLRCLANCNKAQ